MRVTFTSMTENALRYLADNQERISSLQDQINSTKKYQHASDNPSVVSQALTLRSSLRASQAYLETAQNTDSWMSANDEALSSMIKIATNAINLVQEGSNDTLDPSDRATSQGVELKALVLQAVDAGNTKYLNDYIFSGFNVGTPAFTLAADESAVTTNSDTGVIQRDIAPNQTVTANINGQEPAFAEFFAALIKARDILLNDTTTDMASLSDSLEELQTALDDLTALQTSNGARWRQVDAVVDSMDNTTTELAGLLSKKEDTNLAEAYSWLEIQSTTYQATLEVTQRAISALNLFDYLS